MKRNLEGMEGSTEKIARSRDLWKRASESCGDNEILSSCVAFGSSAPAPSHRTGPPRVVSPVPHAWVM